MVIGARLGYAAEFDTLTVASTTVADLKAVFATVESVHVARARSRIAGTVTRLGVVEGDRVRTGQVIASVHDPKLKLERASLDAQIQALEAQLRQNKITLGRLRRLRQSGSASQAQLDDAQTAFNVTTGRLASTRADREVVGERLAEGAVLAPEAGRVLTTSIVEGMVVMPGEDIATIAVDRYLLRLRLPERHARFIHVGDAVLVGARGLSDSVQSTRKGRVEKVYPELKNGRVIADVEVSGLGDYFVGERTRVWVATGRRKTILVPPEYLRDRFGVNYVLVRDPSDKAIEVVVQAGRVQSFDDGRPAVEILSGLAPGDVLLKPR